MDSIAIRRQLRVVRELACSGVAGLVSYSEMREALEPDERVLEDSATRATIEQIGQQLRALRELVS